MTKTSKKNLALWLGVSAGFAIVFGTSATLYFIAGELRNIASKKEYLIRNSSNLTLDGYYFDVTSTYGPAKDKAPQTIMTSNLIRVETTGETKFVRDGIAGDLIVSESSRERLVLDLAKEVVLTFKDSTGNIAKAIFDTDVAEINPSLSSKDKPETVSLKSNNKRSVNSDNFSNLMLGSANLVDGVLVPSSSGSYEMISLGFTVKENVFWVDANGNRTQYKIKPDDFYYSYMRTWLYDTKYRRDNGGSAELDRYFINVSGTATRFTDEKEYPNDYLLGLFGISSSMLRNKATAVTQIEIDGSEKDMFTIHAIPTATNPNFAAFLSKTLLNSYLLSPAPSEYIEELAEENKNIEYPIDAEEKKVTGQAHEFGIYTYGQRRIDNLFASAYVPVSGGNNRIVFEKNAHFANSEFLKDENTLERIIFEHSNSPSFNEQLFNNFFEGTVSEMPYHSLTQQQKIKIFGTNGDEQYAIRRGLLQVKQQNKSTLVQRTLVSTDPRKFTANDSGSYYFNDQYARLIYGSSIEELKNGVANTTNSFFNGTGYQLRTLFNASVNWYTFINNSSKGLKQLWLNNTAPNAKYNFSTDKTPFDFSDKINNIGYFKEDGSKVVITEEEMQNSYLNNSNSIENQYKNVNFNEIKRLVEKILDDNNVTSPLEWSIVYPYDDGVGNRVTIDQLELVAKTLRSLDDKGRINPTVFVPNNRDEMIDAVNSNKAVSDFNGWGYDYEGIGSFLDGISHGKGISLLGAFSLYSDPSNTTIRAQNPEFTKLSIRMKEHLNPILPQGLKVEDWVNFTNDDNNNIDAKFATAGFEVGTELAKFFLMYQEEIDENEITDLIIELNIISGFAMESDISIADARTTSLSLVLPEYFFPTTTEGILYLSDIRLGDKND
ncbi:MAG: OppA family ABC transporter substrate-binding lipoprotein [Metamycoplasmataceae bacterium]